MTITLRYIDDAGELEAHWAEIWPLMDALDTHRAEFLNRELRPRREEKAYERILSGMENDDHWLQVAEEEDGESWRWPSQASPRATSLAFWKLLCPLEDWLVKKGAEVLEAQVLARDDQARQGLKAAGYSSQKYELRKDLGG